MNRYYLIICLICTASFLQAQTNPDSIVATTRDVLAELPDSTFDSQITPSSDIFPKFKFRNEDAPFGKKLVKGILINSAVNATMITVLLLSPKEFSMWSDDDRLKWYMIKQKYRNAFTKAPVIDPDLWITNYIGHPYQGSLYFNTIRSQGSTFIESSVYNLAQSVLWEYAWEAGLEQPSIQDLIVTPIVGTLLGELSHRATISMRKNGFSWYEKVLVCLINPYYAVNNGFSSRPSK